MDDAWASIGAAFGLRFARVPDCTIIGAGFSSLRRAMEPPRVSGPTARPWLVKDGVVVRHERLLGMDYTVVSAEITPALFVGLRMMTRGFGRFPVQPGPTDHHGWGELVVYAHDPPRAHDFLDPRAGTNAFATVTSLAGLGPVAIQDSMVESFLPGFVTDETRIGIAVDTAAMLAKSLSDRSRAVPPSAADERLRATWERYAIEQGLAFDWTRRKMSGGAIEIELDPLPLGVLTTTRVRFREPLAAGLHLRRDPRGRFVAKKQPAPDGVQVGDADLDAQFVIDAVSPDLARSALESATVRAILSELASTSVDLVMNDREIAVCATGAISLADLWSRCGRLDHAAQLVAKTRSAGPYR